LLSKRDAFEHISSRYSDNITEGAAELPKSIEPRGEVGHADGGDSGGSLP